MPLRSITSKYGAKSLKRLLFGRLPRLPDFRYRVGSESGLDGLLARNLRAWHFQLPFWKDWLRNVYDGILAIDPSREATQA